MLKIILLATGGALGTLLRFWMVGGVHALLGRAFPYGTLSVNLLGSFLIGLFYLFFAKKVAIDTAGYTVVVVGVLGAFTTFSAFSIETVHLLETGQFFKSAFNIILNIGLCLIGCWLGLALGRVLTL